MVDRRRIVDLWCRGSGGVLVTLVRIEGSSYRKPGAHLLIAEQGAEYAGTISGGCLEAEIVRKAAWIVDSGPVVKRYSTLFDDTADIPFGLGCGGVVDLLFEPASSPEAHALLSAMEASLTGAEFRVMTCLPEDGGLFGRAIYSSTGTLVFASTGLDLSRGAPRAPLFEQRITPPQRLVVLGAGEDARPVIAMASLLGWRTAAVDGRALLARRDRFPGAEVILPAHSIADLQLTARDAVVLMTHSYEQDRELLAGILSGAVVPGYVGLLGAAHRSSLLVSEAAKLARRSVEDCCERVWAPVGLDLGGDGPEAIALSIIAEVQAWREGRLGSVRRLTPERMAQHLAQGGASLYLRSQCSVGAE